MNKQNTHIYLLLLLLSIQSFTLLSHNVFENIFHQNFWNSQESISGTGSELKETEIIREKLPLLLQELGVESLLDAACGDLNWISHINLPLKKYIGVDIVPALIESNQARYANDQTNFFLLDIAQDPLPKTDLILCRDCLVHHSFESIKRIISNFKASGAKYLLTTTFTNSRKNIDIKTGQWRPLNLQLSPFNFPQPILIINEKCNPDWYSNDYSDKCIAVWLLDDLP